MAKTLFAVLVAVVNGYGIELNDEKVAKDLRVLCGITNKRFFTKNLEWFFELFYRYANSLKKHGIDASDEWIIKNMLRAFKQNKAENKFGGISGLLRSYASEEIKNYLQEDGRLGFEINHNAYQLVVKFVNGMLASKKLVIGKVGLADRLSYLMDLHVSQYHIKADEYGFAVNVTLVLHQDPKVAEEQESVSEAHSVEAEGFRHPLTGISKFIPLAKQCLNPMNGRIAQAVANLNITGSSVAHLSSEVKKEAEKDKTWFELSEKFPDGNISHIAIALAKTAELQERRHQAGTYKGINPLSDKEIEDKLWNPDAKYAFMRNAALGKVTAKPKVNWKDKYDKTDITLRGISLRLWIDRTAKKIPTGFVYVDDNADKPFLRFKWGFRSDGTSHTYPMVERRVPKTDQYELIGNKDQYTDLPAAIRQALEEINIKPGYSNGEVVPGVSITGIIR